MGNDTNHITEINSKKDLLETNEFFLMKYLEQRSIDRTSMVLYYNCVENIVSETSQIQISETANSILRAKIDSGAFLDYLRIFLRPLYSSSSPNFEGKSYYVPEPFYEQIFGSVDQFMSNVKITIKNTTNDIVNHRLVNDINSFMQKYLDNIQNNLGYVDLDSSIQIDKKLHQFVN